MIHLITGDIGTGKTGLMAEIAARLGDGLTGGFVSVKFFLDEGHVGYRLVNVLNSSAVELCVETAAYSGQYSDAFQYDRFTFDKGAFSAGIEIIKESASDDHIKTIIMDEVGPIEQAGGGFYEALPIAFRAHSQNGKHVFIGVRTSCIADLMRRYGIACANCHRAG